MKKNVIIIIINIVLTLGILGFVVLYAGNSQKAVVNGRVREFTDLTVSMEQMTEIYLEGEQNICDLWAKHINSLDMTISEATDFVKNTHVAADVSAHLIFTDVPSYDGFSTRPNTVTGEYGVNYSDFQPFPTDGELPQIGETINVTRSFTNPVNGAQSIAFCNAITFRDENTGLKRDGMILRVVPVSHLKEKWVFPQENYGDAEFTLIDADGNYIIKGHSMKNSNFFEFYKSYNKGDLSDLNGISEMIDDETGRFTMLNSLAESCLIVHTRISVGNGWIMLGYLPENVIDVTNVDWLLIGSVTSGLLLLFAFDMAFMLYFNRKLSETAAYAEKANKAKTDFLSTMSHDIRTPMNAIVGLTSITEKLADDPDVVKENIRKISLASNHLLTLINDILDISKVESGKTTLNPITFSLVETVENLVNLSYPMIKEKNLDFNFRINRMEHEFLRADKLRLNQIYINILSNAIKYTEPNGRITVDMLEEKSEKEGYVRLTYIVADTGIGMSKDFMAKMYQPFSRQTDSRINAIQGTGLGLAITRNMVDLMEGTICCESEEGKGTTFTVTLDLPVAEKEPKNMKLKPVDILLVDDDDILLETAKDVLISLGANAETADSGKTALEMIESRHAAGNDYGVIIIDWKMPETDGIELVKILRGKIGTDLPILLISAYDRADIEDAAKEAGANGFISKPLFRSVLYEKISELLGIDTSVSATEEDYSSLEGSNILVAEDNDVNWEIISTLLGMYGIRTERAENGLVCVEKIKAAAQNDYLLVFMDIQMPVMNGLEATRKIRQMTDCALKDVPIIAMTADAFSENVAECLDAGMNGHIAKPIDVKLVIKEIKKIKNNENGKKQQDN